MLRHDEQPDRKWARTAGLLYFLMMTTVGLHFAVTGNLTAEKLRANEEWYRLAILAGAGGYVVYLLLGLSLYRLFRPVNEAASSVLLAFVGIHTAISLAAIAHQLNALTPEGSTTLSLISFTSYFRLSMIFSGLWLVPLGLLVFRCGFIPKFVGVFHLLGSVFYVMAFAGWVIDPGYDASLAGRIVGTVCGFPSVIGEASTCAFLLIAGFRKVPSGVPRCGSADLSLRAMQG